VPQHEAIGELHRPSGESVSGIGSIRGAGRFGVITPVAVDFTPAGRSILSAVCHVGPAGDDVEGTQPSTRSVR
jgi:hypothetical protein